MSHLMVSKRPTAKSGITPISSTTPLSKPAQTFAMVLAVFFIFAQILFLGSLAGRFIWDFVNFLFGK